MALCLRPPGDLGAATWGPPNGASHSVHPVHQLPGRSVAPANQASAEAGSLSVQVSPVAPEVRIASKQVVSFGDERVVMGINFVAEITRTGLFQLSFPLPDGLEVESLTGESLHHWSELTEKDQRQVVLRRQ